ncbi:MAG TPA: hypothetical protein VIH99_01135 [Bdellovibrionota bacterium]|jgi:hypothetical protein
MLSRILLPFVGILALAALLGVCSAPLVSAYKSRALFEALKREATPGAPAGEILSKHSDFRHVRLNEGGGGQSCAFVSSVDQGTLDQPSYQISLFDREHLRKQFSVTRAEEILPALLPEWRRCPVLHFYYEPAFFRSISLSLRLDAQGKIVALENLAD